MEYAVRAKNMWKLSMFIAVLLAVIARCYGEEASMAKSYHTTIRTSTRFVGKRTYRGRLEARNVMYEKIEIDRQFFENLRGYVGLDSMIGIINGTSNNTNPYAGIICNVGDYAIVDFGYTRHFYATQPPNSKRRTDESYVGLSLKTILSPSLYCFYDFTRHEFAAECKIIHQFRQFQYLDNGFSLCFGAELGFDKSHEPFGVIGNAGPFSAYLYYSLNADLVYSLNADALAKIGIYFGGNFAGKRSWANSDSKTGRSRMWIAGSMNFAF
jgi:hypothetical protein